jgi:POT family proton-dependent oligopeptide transporter
LAVAAPNTRAPGSRTLFPAHPAGLQTLFFTEMWERFSYYGMRALLVLFMVDQVQDGGLELSDPVATAIYGLYTAAVYLLALPGGWVADRLLGAQRAIWFGGIVIMLGHFTLAIPSIYAFFIGLLLVASGTGLLKPNISAVVGELYPPGDPRRDAGFTIFYMGINIGGALGPLVCSTLGESNIFGWHYGFAAAGVGMAVGLWQFRRTRAHLGEAGLAPSLDPDEPAHSADRRRGWRLVWGGIALLLAVLILLLTGAWRPDPIVIARYTSGAIIGLAAVYFTYLFTLGGLDRDEKRRLVVIIVLFFAAAMFWAGFEQAGSTLNLFAERSTQRIFGSFEIPAGWFQTLNPAFIIVLAPLVAAVWVSLARRNLDPPTPVKFGLGLVLLGAGFAVMLFAAELVAQGDIVLPTWLITTYLLHTMGELALSPVGLSATTKLAPRRYVGQMMGVWFLGASLGNVLAGLLAGELTGEAVEQLPALYLQIVLTSVGAGLLMFLFTRPITRLMGQSR